jgi:TRAP-type C4-dicarboxylate transport system substrate-binding protein
MHQHCEQPLITVRDTTMHHYFGGAAMKTTLNLSLARRAALATFSVAVGAAAMIALVAPNAAFAQATKLKWAHVYETSEPYHTESVWAAEEIKKRTNSKFEITVFPASSLGKETDLNQGMSLGTVDMIISGPSFAARSYPRLGIAYYPFIFRDGDHLISYSKSPLFAEMVEEFRAKTGIQMLAYTYYGARMTSSNRLFKDCAGMKNLKIRVPDVPAYMATPKSCGANPTPIAFAEVYLALQTARSKRRKIR